MRHGDPHGLRKLHAGEVFAPYSERIALFLDRLQYRFLPLLDSFSLLVGGERAWRRQPHVEEKVKVDLGDSLMLTDALKGVFPVGQTDLDVGVKPLEREHVQPCAGTWLGSQSELQLLPSVVLDDLHLVEGRQPQPPVNVRRILELLEEVPDVLPGRAELVRREDVAEVVEVAEVACEYLHGTRRYSGQAPGIVQSQNTASSPVDLETYETARVHVLLTEVRRLITGTIAPHAALDLEDKRIRHIVAQLNSVESTLDLIA